MHAKTKSYVHAHLHAHTQSYDFGHFHARLCTYTIYAQGARASSLGCPVFGASSWSMHKRIKHDIHSDSARNILAAVREKSHHKRLDSPTRRSKVVIHVAGME
jgi:hypothetical protein